MRRRPGRCATRCAPTAPPSCRSSTWGRRSRSCWPTARPRPGCRHPSGRSGRPVERAARLGVLRAGRLGRTPGRRRGRPDARLHRSVRPLRVTRDAPGGWGELTLPAEAGELVVVKQYASAFFGTSLASTLHAAGVDTVVIAGVSTSGCVRATAMDALNAGFRPQVVRDACADRTAALHENNLSDLDAKYADVGGLAEAL